jgi:hypothetical protein
MRDTESPASALAQSLGRISVALMDVRAGKTDADAFRARVEKELAVCVENLQFHDRLIQQLATVRGVLTHAVSDSAPALTGFDTQRRNVAAEGSVELF